LETTLTSYIQEGIISTIILPLVQFYGALTMMCYIPKQFPFFFLSRPSSTWN